MSTFNFFNKGSEDSEMAKPQLVMSSQGMQSRLSGSPSDEGRALTTESLADPAASWKLVSQSTLAEGLTVSMNQGGGFDLTWTNPQQSRAEPTVLVLAIPSRIIEEMNGWRFKADLVTNYLSSEAHLPCEPLATPFFKSLMGQGYLVKHIESAQLSEAAIDLRLAKEVSIVKSQINGAMKLECDHLTLQDVKATNCRIEMRVKSGRWSGFRVDGDKSYLIGDAGTTEIDETSHFRNVLWEISLRNASFKGADFLAQSVGGVVQYGCFPSPYHERLSVISNEEYERRKAQSNISRPEVKAGKWDRNVDAL